MNLPLHSFIASLALASAALAQSTAFMYQGVLKSNGQFASGLYDMRFRLFDAQSNGTQIGSDICENNILVVDGKFTRTLDFGQQFITNDPRFLELEVRRDTDLDCTNSSSFVLIGPRQLLTQSPLASHAPFAFGLDAPDGSPLNAVSVTNNRKVGFGTPTPLSSLHIRRSDPFVILQDSGPDATQAGYVGFWNLNSTETGWIGFGSPGSAVFSIVNARSAGHIAFSLTPSGNVGIDTQAPLAKLDVRGDIRMGTSGQNLALRGDENLKILRGAVNDSGGRVRGAGFTSTRLDEGKFRIDFSTPFSDIPAVSATSSRSIDHGTVACIDSVSVSSVTIVTYSFEFNRFFDTNFEFLIVGPR